jgi:methylisocitrate lyase
MTPAARLRALLSSGRCIPIPGAFNALCARAIARAGFDACYISGAATSVSAGVPDVGVLTLDHFARTIRESADASGLPIIADADTGFGEAEMVRRTVLEYAKAGAAALHIEDQVFPKRCGHLDGKSLVPLDHMVEKVQWAVKAARDVGCGMSDVGCSTPSPARSSTSHIPHPTSHILICARTDARSVDGMEEAVRRARAYAEAGAEMIFPEGLTSEAEFQQFAHAMKGGKAGDRSPYLLANMTEFGKTPIIPLSRFQQMGYSCVIYPVTLLRVAMGAVTRALEQLKRDGSVEGLLNQMQTRQELYDLIGYTPGKPWEWPANR